MLRALVAEAFLDAGDAERARAVAEEAVAIARKGGWLVANRCP